MAENIIVDENDDGQRIDRWLKKKFPAFGFVQVQKVLRTGQVRVDGKRIKGDARLVTGQTVRIPPQLTIPPEKKYGLSSQDTDFIKSLVIYEDEHIFALNKPPGIAVQGGSKIVRHIDGLLEGLAFKGNKPHLVHRLDKDTSGVLLIARHAKAAKAMGHLFKGRRIRKYYWGVTVPTPDLEKGEINASLAKVATPEGGKVVVMEGENEGEGKHAYTYYAVKESVGGRVAWVAFWPRTGRTHQIRVHAAHMKCPLLGDYKYGPDQGFLEDSPSLPKILHLHAHRVIFQHPITGKQVDVIAKLSEDMAQTFSFFGFDANDKSDPFEELEL